MPRRLALLLPLAAVLLASGCAASPTAEPTSAPTATPRETAAPTATPTAAPSDDSVTEVVVRAWGLELKDADGDTVYTHEWADAVDATVDALEDAFGDLAAVEFREGDGTHIADAITYGWEGFTLSDAQNLDQDRADYAWPSTVEVTAAEVNGVAVTTAEGVSVGDDLTSVPQDRQEDLGETGIAAFIDPEDETWPSSGTRTVQVFSDGTRATVRALFAPQPYPGL